MSKKVAVLLAGGKGTRLVPYTLTIPKPLVSVGEYPILEIILRQLKLAGFTDIYIAVNHMANMIEDYFGDGSRLGLRIQYFLETKPLGTMGPLIHMEQSLPESFLVMNGDILSDIDFAEFLDSHQKSDAIFSISAKARELKVDYGVLHMDAGGMLCGMEEKPVLRYLVSMGVYAVNKSVIQYIPKDEYFGFDTLMAKLMKVKQPVRVNQFAGYWNDIGRPEDYERAIKDIDSLTATFLR